jgi:hypothetical protein
MTSARRVRLAIALWVTFAIVVWNVVFDRVLVLAGRRYVAAAAAVAGTGTYLHIDDWMRPALVRGLWLASASGGAVLVTGLTTIVLAARRERESRHKEIPCAPSLTR